MCCTATSCRSCPPPKIGQVIVGSSYGFFSNIERAIIMPSLWLYMQTAWGEQTARHYYALTLGSFALAILLFTPVVGYLAYLGVQTPILLLVSNCFEIIGNVLYLVGHQPWLLVVGRFISGMGACCDPALCTDLTLITSRHERMKFIIGLIAPRQIGLLVGPCFTILLDKLQLDLGDLHLTVYNVPGLIMTGLWALHCLLVIALYPDISELIKPSVDCSRESGNPSSIVGWLCYARSRNGSIESNSGSLGERHPLKRYATFPLVTLFIITYYNSFSLMGFEALLPPVTLRTFDWTELQVSYTYLYAGLIVIITYIIVSLLSNRLADRTILLTGLICMLIAFTWLAFLLTFNLRSTARPIGIGLTIGAITVFTIGVPMVASGSETLFTKLSPQNDLDRGQIIFRTMANIGFLLGPYFGGSMTYAAAFAFLVMAIQTFVPLSALTVLFDKFSDNNNLRN